MTRPRALGFFNTLLAHAPNTGIFVAPPDFRLIHPASNPRAFYIADAKRRGACPPLGAKISPFNISAKPGLGIPLSVPLLDTRATAALGCCNLIVNVGNGAQKRRGPIAAFGPFAAVRGRSEKRAVCARMQPKGGTRQTHCEGRCDRTGIRATESRRCALGRGDEDDADTRATQSNSSTEIPTEHRVSVCVALRLADPNRAVLRAKPFRVAGPRCARLEIARWRGGGAANRT